MKFRKVLSTLFFVLVFSISYLLVFYYPILEVGKLLGIYYNLKFQTLALILLILPLIMRLLGEKFNNKYFRFVLSGVMFYLGFSFILLSTIIVFKIIKLFYPLNYIYLGNILLGITIMFSTYGIINANILSIKTIKIKSSKIKKEYKIVQLTDIHIGSRSKKFLEKIVDKTNRLESDYVVITGDLVDFNSVSYEHLRPLEKLKAKKLFVIGNHERYVNTENVIEILKKLKVNILRNELFKTNEIDFIGIDDADSKYQVKDVIKNVKVDNKKFSILLYHRPNGFKDAVHSGVDLQLSGHTHKGQIFPFNFLVKLQFKYVSGLKRIKDSYLYVSPGTGTWGPILRLGSRNEITLIKISR